MTHASLAANYRPQTFAQVTGQQMITTVLSRACAQESVAPAYLLSGTRGVGKTTIARIFAKALNCVQAPTNEPCNVCDQCQKITQGNHVDVTEIDGASNNSVDDARALREHIGYAAMEGRYKVFIIDEAHMLSRNAFNALLKTLEEPPPRVVFIFATTEVHKFPITIISRCQHFIFKRLAEDELMDHLNNVLSKEGVEHEQNAVRLIARRAAGSVRDGMSLLGQSLALGEKKLTLDNTRMVLGLAGQDFFEALMQGIVQNDCQSIVELSSSLGEQGIDIGFFLRELTNLWRTLFLLREAGANILPSLNLSFDEAKLWSDMAPMFSSAHLHAAWHMTLDAQRKIIHSPEPAAALELLLLNLALMPRLLPLNKLDDLQSAPPSNSSNSAPHGSTNGSSSSMPPATNNVQNSTLSSVPDNEVTEQTFSETKNLDEFSASIEVNDDSENINRTLEKAELSTSPSPIQAHDVSQNASQSIEDIPTNVAYDVNQNVPTKAQSNINPTWEDLRAFIQEYGQENGKAVIPSHILHQAKGIFNANNLEISTGSNACYDKLSQNLSTLEKLCAQYCGMEISINIQKPQSVHKAESILKQEFKERADLQACLNILDATILHVSPMNKSRHSNL